MFVFTTKNAFHPFFLNSLSLSDVPLCDLFIQYRTSFFNRLNYRPNPTSSRIAHHMKYLIIFSDFIFFKKMYFLC